MVVVGLVVVGFGVAGLVKEVAVVVVVVVGFVVAGLVEEVVVVVVGSNPDIAKII